MILKLSINPELVIKLVASNLSMLAEVHILILLYHKTAFSKNTLSKFLSPKSTFSKLLSPKMLFLKNMLTQIAPIKNHFQKYCLQKTLTSKL